MLSPTLEPSSIEVVPTLLLLLPPHCGVAEVGIAAVLGVVTVGVS